MPYRPGQIIGRHELVAPLGAGSMGEVWQAVLHGPQGFDKPVALKLLRESPGEVLRGALIREARLGALLHHPNVVGIYELGSADGLWFVAMELVRGPSVADLIRTQHPLSPAAVLDIGVQAAAGLRHVHALKLGDRPAGLVHRDVKPSNLLVDRTGLVKVADLGMASVSGSPSTGGGTPPYLAPEQARGQQDARADVWALGVVLYELATGDRPFGSGVEAISRARKVEERLVVPAFLDPVELAVKGLGEVVRRCLRLDPDDRWPSMAELGAALTELAVSAAGENLVELLARTHPELDVVDAGIRSSSSRSSPSTPATVVVPDGNLPDPRDRFHGRVEEVERLTAQLGRERLVTLVGFGGLGKTRLALETGRAVAGGSAPSSASVHFPGGVWCTDLSECRTELDLCATISRSLGASPDRTDPCAPAADALRALGRVLVVLDNLEQVRAPAAALLGRWLEGVPEATFLCTSRAPLGVRGERLFPLGPLDPESAFALFVDRAPTPPPAQHHPEVRALVEALDYLPLAIELAAARTRVMPVPQIARRLDDQLRLLAGGGEQYPERHRSLLASITWSWELLQPGHRAAMAQLSVLEGGFTLEAAEGVLDLTLFSGVHWAIDVLHELVDASLLRVDPVAGRFSMLQAVHAFASDRLGGPDRLDAEVRHGRFFARMSEGAPFPVLVAEIDNLEAATRRAVTRGDAAVAGAAALAAVKVHERQGPLRRSAELMELVLGLPDLDPAVRIAVQRGAGRLRVLVGDGAVGRAHLEEALRSAREAGLPLEQASSLSALGSALSTFGEHQAALVLYDEGLVLARAIGARAVEAQLLQNLANAQQALGRSAEARATYEAAIAILQRVGPARSLVLAQSNLGALHMDIGEPELALGYLSRALDGCTELGDRRQEATIRGNLGQVMAALGMLVEARGQLEDAQRLHQRIGNRRSEAYVLANLGGLWQREGRWHHAVDEHERALALARQIGLRKLEGGVLRELARDRLAMGDAATARVLLDDAERLLREVGAPYDLARALCLRAELDPTGRDQALGEARALAAELGVGPRSDLAVDLARAQTS